MAIFTKELLDDLIRMKLVERETFLARIEAELKVLMDIAALNPPEKEAHKNLVKKTKK